VIFHLFPIIVRRRATASIDFVMTRGYDQARYTLLDSFLVETRRRCRILDHFRDIARQYC